MELVSGEIKFDVHSLLEDSTDMITRAKLDGTLTYVSPACRFILGFSPSDLIGKNGFDFFHPEDIKILEAGVKRLLEGAVVDTIIYRSVKKDGTYVWLESTGRLIRNSEGEVLEIQGSTRDITERLRYQLELEKRFRNLEDEVSKRKLVEEDLIHEKNFKESIIDHSALGVTALDSSLRIKEWNPALEKMTGKNRADVMGKAWTELYPVYIGSEIHMNFLRVLKGEVIEIKAAKFNSKEGYHNTILSPLRGENGQINGILSITDDITEEYLLKKQITESEAFLKQITDSSPNIIAVTEYQSGTLVFANREFYQLFGIDPDTTIISTIKPFNSSFIHHEDLNIAHDWLKKIAGIKNQEREEAEFRVIDAQGKVHWYNMRAVVFRRNEAGEVVEFLTNAKEVTSRKVAELELMKNRDLLREAQRSARLGIWEWDIVNDYISWSEELYKIYGLNERPAKLEYSTFIDLVHPEDREMVNHIVSEAFKNSETFTFEHRLIQPNGGIRHLLANGKIVNDSAGRPIQMIGTALDVSDLRGTEALLRKKEEFMSIASHELKTPLTSAKAYVDLLKRELAKTQDQKLIDYASRTGVFIEKLNGLISDLLDISKIQAGRILYQFADFDLDQMVLECCETFQATIPKHKIQVKGACGVSVFGDRDRLSQVLSNLLNNAAKYSPESNLIEVNIRKKGTQVQVSVKDHGIGIDEENLPKVFERFYRVEDKRNYAQGLGIGLYLCKEIIERHDGKIYVHSELDKGSEFTFELSLGR